MKIDFFKYQGTGNDFVMIDNRDGRFSKNDTTAIERICDRRFGIGGDGLILLENLEGYDFKMVYYNSDGNESSMCGNGGRCIVAFAEQLGIINSSASFLAIDGPHVATIAPDGLVSLKMSDVWQVDIQNNHTYLNTGSPHHVELVDNLPIFDVKQEGSKIRHGRYGINGSNVNFVMPKETDIFSVRTYERGVEDETLSCGTGVTAVAIAMHATGKTSSSAVKLVTPGGDLEVSFTKNGDRYENIFLKGPATFVFKGQIDLNS